MMRKRVKLLSRNGKNELEFVYSGITTAPDLIMVISEIENLKAKVTMMESGCVVAKISRAKPRDLLFFAENGYEFFRS